MAQDCEKHAASNAFLGQYLGSYHMRWTSKGNFKAFEETSVAIVRLAASPLIRPTICKVTFLPTCLEPHFKIENVKRVYFFSVQKILFVSLKWEKTPTYSNFKNHIPTSQLASNFESHTNVGDNFWVYVNIYKHDLYYLKV